MKRIIAIALLIVTLSLVFVSCSSNKSTYGTIRIELYEDLAPITCENFKKLAESGYYNGTSIIRVQKGFVVQGGQGKGTPSIKGEFQANGIVNNISHTKGILSMARSTSMDSASDQFFICLSDSCTQLDGSYAGFGEIVSGWDVVEKIVDSITEKDIPEVVDYNSYQMAAMGFLKETSYITIKSATVVTENGKTYVDMTFGK